MISKKELLKNQIDIFYADENNMNNFIEIIKFSNPVSLRLIDWFVTNYAKHFSNQIVNELGIDLYSSYKGQLKSYNKSLFDCFCRNINKNNNKNNNKITIDYIYKDNHFKFDTSLAQLNFFRWAFSLNLIVYIKKNLFDIKSKLKIKKEIKNNNKIIKESIISNNMNNLQYSISF